MGCNVEDDDDETVDESPKLVPAWTAAEEAVYERATATPVVDDAAFILPTHCGLEQAGCDFRALGVDGQAKALENPNVPPATKAAWVEWFRTQEGK